MGHCDKHLPPGSTNLVCTASFFDTLDWLPRATCCKALFECKYEQIEQG